jgi:hypothetical protein
MHPNMSSHEDSRHCEMSLQPNTQRNNTQQYEPVQAHRHKESTESQGTMTSHHLANKGNHEFYF